MALPPLLAGAVQLTVAIVLPAVALTPVGEAGGPAGVTAAVAADGAPEPSPLVA
jgi:hypothetical protein